jgi:hypothetical protein
MVMLAIRYTIDPNRLADFEAYARELPPRIERCEGTCIADYLPTKIAGPTNAALGLVGLTHLAAYERYRDRGEPNRAVAY